VSINRKMSDKHEAFLCSLFDGRPTKGSGNQWRDPTDGRNNHMTTRFAFAWDGKSTLGKSVGVSREMWGKVVEQAGAERPMLPLRFYDNERLDVGLDLVVVNAYDLSEMLSELR
jgi:hypothetical protein